MTAIKRYHSKILKKCKKAGFVLEERRENGHVVITGKIGDYEIRWTWGTTPSRTSFNDMLSDIKKDFKEAGYKPPNLPKKGPGQANSPPEPLHELLLTAQKASLLLEAEA